MLYDIKCASVGVPVQAKWSLMPVLVSLAFTLNSSAVTQLETSDRCGSCHRDIFKMWQKSGHANSMESAAFLESFRQSQTEWGEERSRICLHCHAPTVVETGDWDLSDKVTWEGVSCDVCHSLVDVDLSGHAPRMRLDIGDVKRGPITDAASTGHEVAYSPLHEKAIACAPCHEYTNADGTPIMTTFSEWRNSQAAEDGKTCQSCHMWRTEAAVVDPRVQRASQAVVNLHEMPGGHSLHQLLKALDIEYDLERTGNNLNATVRIANVIGHAVPTGMPGRQIILTVRVEADAMDPIVDVRDFGNHFVDAAGDPVEHVWGFFESGIQLDADTRIAADSEWSETFRYSLPQDAVAYFRIRLEYMYSTADMRYEATRFVFFSEGRTVARPRQ